MSVISNTHVKDGLTLKRLSAYEIMQWAIWFGLATGLGEVLIQVIRKFLLHRIIGLSAELVWMAPVMDLIFFLLVGLVLVLCSLFIPRAASLRVIIPVFTTLSIFIILLYFPLHWAAAGLLALGLSIAISNFLLSRWTNQIDSIKRSVAGLAAVVAVLAVGLFLWQWFAERNAVRDLPPAAADKPNVILIVLDTVRAGNMSLNGYDRATTPNLDTLAKRSMVFEQALSTAPWTLPSHASMFTGLWPSELMADWSVPLSDQFSTMAEVLQSQGYLTAGFVANTFYTNEEHGLAQGFIHFEDFPVSVDQIFISSVLGQKIACWRQMGFGCDLRQRFNSYELPGRKNAGEVNADFLEWLGKQDQRPFFVFLNYFDAHAPYLPPEPYDKLFGDGRQPNAPVYIEGQEPWQGTPDQLNDEIDAYDGTIAYMDSQIGLLVDRLAELGQIENTVLIITSDHGEEFQEHGVMSHGHSLYRQGVQVPLLIHYPEMANQGDRIPVGVSLRDLFVTVLDILNIENSFSIPGSSLLEFANGAGDTDSTEGLLSQVSAKHALPDWYPISKGDMVSLVVDGTRYIQSGDGSVEMYDFYSDTGEQTNLAGTMAGNLLKNKLRDFLNALLSGN